MTDAQKDRLKEGRDKAREARQEKLGSFVTKDEFTNFAKEVTGSIQTLVDLVKDSKVNTVQPINTGVPVVKPDTVDSEPEKSVLPPKWREIVDKMLGKDFGINVVYPDQGRGFLFKIIVPKDKSNMSESLRTMYKVDVRTRSIGFGEGIEGVKKYCEAVAKNLGIDSKQVEKDYSNV